MRLSGFPYKDDIRKVQQVRFGGLNHNLGAPGGELWDMQNLSSDLYPLLAPRAKRHTLRTLTAPNGLYHSDKLYEVDGSKLYADGELVGSLPSAGEKTLLSIGKRLLIFPDKLMYTEGGGIVPLEASASSVSCKIQDGTYAEVEAAANTIYSTGVMWTDYFKAGDAVTITGASVHPENNRTAIIREISTDGHSLRFYENTFTINDGGDTETLTLRRAVPDLDFLCVNENRVWGCKGDTIWCSKLGDPFNWYVFDGISTDAWSVESGTAGDFTACCSFLGYPIFFKEDRIFKVYGNKPTNFELMSSATLGVVDGSAKSLAVADETLFYLSRVGIVAYNGGIPRSIAEPFGVEQFSDATGGSDGKKYYVSMRAQDGAYSLFVYDTARGLWHREDNTQVVSFAYGGGLYALAADGALLLLGRPQAVPGGATPEQSVPWEAEFADYTMDSFNGKYPTHLRMRISGEKDASFSVSIKYDSGDAWETVIGITLPADTKRAEYLSVPIRRCDHFRLKLTGVGVGRLHACELEFYEGKSNNSRK